MRWFTRSVVLCLLILVVTPTRADAWFEWLDRLSGPGSWWGMKADIRAVCWGTVVPPSTTYRRTPEAMRMALTGPILERESAVEEMRATLEQLRKVNASLNLISPTQLTSVENNFRRLVPGNQPLRVEVAGLSSKQFEVEALVKETEQLEERAFRAFLAIASSGILLDLCPVNVLRSFALEVGLTGLWTGGNDTYADNNHIWMSTATVGFSYRVPLPITRDFIDLGTNLGVYRFYSHGFDDFSGVTMEPFVDLHLPTKFRLDGSKWERIFSRVTLRTGLQFFPGGFKAAQFAAQPGTPDITGREANPSMTVFFTVWKDPAPKPGAASLR